MAREYLSKDQLNGFEHYKYSSIDTNPLSNYVMHPFWNQVVKIVPKWIAPNVLTFSGFMLTTLNTLLLTFYDYNFCGSSDRSDPLACDPIPSWVWIACAVNHFLAHTLDGIDGKHARRTNASGPLGELMDHGLDSWACLLMPTCLYSVFGRTMFGSTDPFRVFLSLWVVHICFYLSHWEKYITGVLYLPWSYDLSQIVLLGAFLVTFAKSYTFWKFTIPFLNIGTADLTEVIIYACSFGLTIPVAFYNIYRAYKEGRVKPKSFMEAVRPGIPLLIFFVMTVLWALGSPSDIIKKDPRMFYYLVGTVFSNIACRLIISQMSSTRCETLNGLMYPVGLALAVVFGVPQLGSRKEILVLRVLVAVVTVAHLHYGIYVVKQMCKHFKINCFSLKKPVSD